LLSLNHEEGECAQAAQTGENKANGSDNGFLSEFVGVKAEADDDCINAGEEGVDRDGDQVQPAIEKYWRLGKQHRTT